MTPHQGHCTSSRIAVLVPAFLVLFATAAAATFDIPAQAAPPALRLFIKQSGAQVLFNAAELKSTPANAVKGDYEPAAALDILLANTGYQAEKGNDTGFVVVSAVSKPGSIEGSLRDESGKPVAGAKVAIADSDKAVATDKRGRFLITAIPAGTYVLQVSAEGLQNARVTDVTVNAGRELSLSPITIPVRKQGTLELETYTVSAKKNDGVVELDPYSVEGQKEKPFSGANVDIPRTINDVQPYFIFDAKTIDQSGATNVEDFLKKRLTMNTNSLTNSQQTGDGQGRGATSTFNLRGLGADKTLVLVNGRRISGVQVRIFAGQDSLGQPDVNGIPMSAVDRIEILPSSASGIYGGSAIGGVINIILKSDYHGATLSANYDNSWDTDAPTGTVSLSYGMALEGGRTNFLLTAQWSGSKAMLYRDRRGLYEQNAATIAENSPTFINGSNIPLGALPNIRTVSGSSLRFKNGTLLNSPNTFIPSGTSPSTSSATLMSGLQANAGKYSLELPESNQAPTGLLRRLAQEPTTKALQAALRRRMTTRIELFADFSYLENRSEAVSNVMGTLFIPASVATNPFNNLVRITFPSAVNTPTFSASDTRTISIGAKIELPHAWTGQLDYSWSSNKISFQDYNLVDDATLLADLNSGVFNPFTDTLAFPIDLRKYLVRRTDRGTTELEEFALRGSGPLLALPWGTPRGTTGIARRIQSSPEYTDTVEYPVSKEFNTITSYFPSKQITDSAYLELEIPLLQERTYRLAHSLALQASARVERYTVDGGTQAQRLSPNLTPPTTEYIEPTLNGQPFKSKVRYSSENYTIGAKYEITNSLMVRASIATAFVPPDPRQLIEEPNLNLNGYYISSDPKNPAQDFEYIPARAGGNPELKSEHSKSTNVGLVWKPNEGPLRNLQLNVEYYKIKQQDAIISLSAQSIVDNESAYPGRVTRDVTGKITQVDVRTLNLYRKLTSGWDFGLSYDLKTSLGTFQFDGGWTLIEELKTQYDASLPEFDAAGYHPTEGGAPKLKSAFALSWEHGHWGAGWTVTTTGSYKQYGAAGGPSSIQYADGLATGDAVIAQGSETIPSQTYHDMYWEYSSAARNKASGTGLRDKLLSNWTVRVGIRNIFNKAPPLDASYYSFFYASPYGDYRLRSYWVNLTKRF